MEALLTAEQAALRFNVPRRWLVEEAINNRVPHLRVGLGMRFDPTKLAGHLGLPAAGAPAAATGLLRIAQVAEELGTTELAVKRLIARGHLPAVRLGAEGEWRVAAVEVSDYARQGAADFDMPALDGVWLDDPVPFDRRLPMRFFDAVRAAAQSLVPSDAQLVKQLTPVNGVGAGATVEIVPDAAVRTLMGGPPKVMMRETAEQAARYGSWARLYAVERVRTFAREDLAQRGDLPGTPIEKLYASPAVYQEVTSAAQQRFLAGAIGVARRTVQVPDRYGDLRTVPVSVEVPHRSIGAGNNIEAVAF